MSPLIENASYANDSDMLYFLRFVFRDAYILHCNQFLSISSIHTDLVRVCLWTESLQVDRPRGMTLADGVLMPHMLSICHAKSHLI